MYIETTIEVDGVEFDVGVEVSVEEGFAGNYDEPSYQGSINIEHVFRLDNKAEIKDYTPLEQPWFEDLVWGKLADSKEGDYPEEEDW